MTGVMDKSMLAALTTELATKQADATRIANTFAVDDKGRLSMSADKHRDYVAAVKAAAEVKSVLDANKTLEEIGAYLDTPDEPSHSGRDFGAGRGGGDMQAKDLGSMFTESKAYQEARAAHDGRMGESFRGMLRAGVEGKSIYNFTAGSVTHQALGRAEQLPMVDRQLRKTHIRDLFPKSSTRASVLWGVKETGWVNNARQVNQRYAADGVSPAAGLDTDRWGNAPKSKITMTPTMFPIAAIKHSLDAHRHILDDEPRLKTFLNTRMIDGVKYAEDYDLLHSVGSGEQITGLFNTDGVQEYTGLRTDKQSVQVRRAITRALLAEYDPNGLVLSPTMWEGLELEEDGQGNFRIAVAVAIGAEKRIWRLNTVETTAMSDDRFIIGNFGMGAQLHDREVVSVSVSTEHANNYTEGIVTFLAEERVGFEVSRPESFVIGTWTDYAPV